MELDGFEMVMRLLAGLTLFFLGVEQMVRGFKDIAGKRVRNLLASATGSPLKGILAGTVATTILDSSSAVIVMTITLVHTHLLTYVEALGIVLGANIGTTIGSQIIAFKLHAYAPIAMATGLLLWLGSRNPRTRTFGQVCLGFGLLFFGLGSMGEAMSPLRDYQPFVDRMATLGDRPLMGALLGGFLTLCIQSSSATVAIAIVMAMEGLMPLSTGVAIMLGAEVGTVGTTLIASIGRSRPTVRTALFHLVFNATTVTLGLLLIGPLTRFAQALTPGGSVARQIANAHVLFNVLGVALYYPFLPLIADALIRLLPDDSHASESLQSADEVLTTSDAEPAIRSDSGSVD